MTITHKGVFDMHINYSMDIKEVTPDFLMRAIVDIVDYGLFESRENFYHTEVNPKGSMTDFIVDTRKAVDEYFQIADHGYAHSVNVYKRCEEIVYLIKEEDVAFNIDKIEYLNILKLASIFHDLSRFYGVSGFNHEHVSKELAENVLYQGKNKSNDYIKSMVLLCIERHDWFSLDISGGIREELKKTPIVDIFRLADKTSTSPEEELNRHYETGKRYKTPFFNPELGMHQRFNFKNNHKERDVITHFLLFFLFNEHNFFFNTTSRLYKEWAKDKKDLKSHILDYLCKVEQIPTDHLKTIETILRKV